MKLLLQKPNKALNKAYLKEKVSRNDIEKFKSNLKTLLSKISEGESEEHHKYPVADFLNDTWYKDNYYINTKERADFVIHNGKTAKETAGVLLEVKSPTNTSEMITADKPNKKAMQELVLYYLRERVEHNNIDIKHLVITNVNEWYVFDEVWFEKNIFRNGRLKKDYETYKQSGKDTKFFYDSIARPALDDIAEPLHCAHFNIRNYERIANNADKTDDNKLIPLYKLLSPTHLLKQPFANDSNSLDTKFYTELLHIIGLEEVKEGGKKLISRKKVRDSASLLESAIMKLEDKDSLRNISGLSSYGTARQDQLYNVALELCITWVNRILFIKLLEGQLVTYNKGSEDYRFLNPKVIFDYDELNNLFFSVLAERPADRRPHVKEKFCNVPYLNSSLFDRTTLEREAIEIDVLDNRSELPILSTTVLKNEQGKRTIGMRTTLHYLFDFLDAYDFSSDGGEEIQEENKNLINASVLGLIFEKINGYKDGSFFTPGFITMYMCRETIRRAVLQKFKDAKGWDCETIDQLYERIDVKDKTEANNIINSLHICDPAVGSGHFLVSALNELIAIKSELKILQDRQHKSLRDYHVEVVNDELVVTDEDGNLLDYNPRHKESQRIQEALFHEKETLIENCLFGVDINPNSVKICRLRLWIELLKNTYYTADSNYTELETLPNIDINIKCGNSLISRFALDADLGQALKKSKWNIDSYRAAVNTYRNAESKDEKREMERLIDDIKGNFRTEIGSNDPKIKKLQRLNTEYYQKYQAGTLFDAKLTKEQKKHKADLEKEIEKLDTDIKEIKSNKIYENAFEWRFEFPEVLDDDGGFIGFDIVIGNPPYGVELSKEQQLVLNNIYDFGTTETAILFIKKGFSLLKSNANQSYIIPKAFTYASNYGKIRNETLDNLISIVDCGKVWQDVKLEVCIFHLTKTEECIYTYLSRKRLDHSIVLLGLIEKTMCRKFDFLLNGLSEKEIEIGNNVKDRCISLNLVSSNQRGGMFQKYVGETGEFKAIGGSDVARFMLKEKVKGHVDRKNIQDNKSFIVPGSILVQNIVAHIENPESHIKIICAIPENLETTVILDTINQLIPINGYSNYYLCGLLNSKFLNWYTYRFVFGKAIRTMHFDNSTTEKILVPKASEGQLITRIENNVYKIIDGKRLEGINSSSLENEIDQLVYQLYGLTEEEIKIVEGN